MSMTTANAKIYIARIIGGANDPKVLDMAAEALERGYADWQAARFWRFLLKDTSVATLISGVTIENATADLSPPSTGAFDFVNVGQTVTISTAGTNTPTLAADTTVQSVTRGSDGVITAITLTAAFATSGADSTGNTISFSANIPILTGVRDYNLPTDFKSPFTARLISNTKRPLVWRDSRHWDRVIWTQTTNGLPQEYTTYNPYSEATQNFGHTRLRLDRPSSAADTLELKYYRAFTTTGTNVDMPDDYLYKFLDYCRSLLLEMKRAQDDPVGYRASVMDSFEQAQENDNEPTDDDDDDSRLKSTMEMGEWSRQLWSNGDFDATR